MEVHQISSTSSDLVFGMRLNISAPTQASLLINEVLPGAAGAGFVEIHNPGASPVNLRDHYLTDDPANLRKFRISERCHDSRRGAGFGRLCGIRSGRRAAR